MTAERKRRSTRLGMGAVTPTEEPPARARRPRGVDCPAPRAAPPALDAMPATELANASGSGVRRRTHVMETPEEHADTLPASLESSLSPTTRLEPQASRERVVSASLSSQEAFVLGMIDGTLSVEDIVDASAMREEDALPIIERLVRLGLVSLLAV